MKNHRLSHIADHFNTEAGVFDTRVLKIIPHYREMLAALVNSLPFPAEKKLRVLDLGCGTGTVAVLVKNKFPNAAIRCVDLVPNMLDLAAKKLRSFSGVEFEQADFQHYVFKAKYHVVVSSLALHHLETDTDKTNLHRRIFHSLAKGGVFANADITLSAKPFLQKQYLANWAGFIRKSYSQAEVEKNYRRYQHEDRPAVLTKEIRSLERIGFSPVEVVWKYYNFVTYAAYK